MHRTEREIYESEMNIYANADPIYCTETENTRRDQTPQPTESDSVKSRISRAAPVCLVLLCFLLLTAVIVLSVLIYTNNTNYTQEREELQSRITNLTKEREDLLTEKTDVTNERDQLLNKTTQLGKEKEKLLSNYNDLIKQRDQLKNDLLKKDGWINYQSSLYFNSSEEKSWTESRRDCTEKGADLIIINNKEEQTFVRKFARGARVWIGLTDSDVEDTWKWVDGSALTTTFWYVKEPNGGRRENCVLNDSEWADYPCDSTHRWICEKKI